MRTLALAISLALALAGCVSLTPVQQARVDEMQAFADRATAANHVPRVRVNVQATSKLNIGAVYRQGNILVSLQTVDSPTWKKTMAHEIGRSQRIVDRGAPVTPGHLPPSAELADLLARFPESHCGSIDHAYG